MSDISRFSNILNTLNGALDLLSEYKDELPSALHASSLPSLLEQCERIVSKHHTAEPIRTLHHFASTGGTVMSKIISAMPNVVLLSEIDPLSTMMVKRAQPPFTPSDLIAALRHAFRTVDEDLLIEIFLQGVRVLTDRLRYDGRSLVLRDHAHSQFCVRRNPADRPTLREILSSHHELLSLVTIRHPLDSYASLVSHGWNKHFEPSDLDTYAQRYALFLDAHADLPLFKFEDFIEDPSAVSAAMCRHLDLAWSGTPQDVLSVVKMSGDSGRSADFIAPRQRRDISEALNKEATASRSYLDLCSRLKYEA